MGKFLTNKILGEHNTTLFIQYGSINKFTNSIQLISYIHLSRSTRSIRLMPTVHLVVLEQRQSSLKKKLDLRPPVSKRRREITDKIAEFVALDMRPVNIVEGKCFKEWMHTLEPGFTVPKREMVMHAVECEIHVHKGRGFRVNKPLRSNQPHRRYLDLTANEGISDSFGRLYYWRLATGKCCFRNKQTKQKMDDSYTAEHWKRSFLIGTFHLLCCSWQYNKYGSMHQSTGQESIVGNCKGSPLRGA